jgi:hypothetical protein
MTAFVISSAVETSLIIFSDKNNRFRDVVRNDKEQEGNKNFAHELCDTK